MTEHTIEPGQMYQLYGNGNIFVVVEPKQGQFSGWLIFNISKNEYDWDMATAFRTQYRRLA